MEPIKACILAMISTKQMDKSLRGTQTCLEVKIFRLTSYLSIVFIFVVLSLVPERDSTEDKDTGEIGIVGFWESVPGDYSSLEFSVQR